MKSNYERVKQGTKRLPPSVLVEKGRLVVSMMDGNPTFPAPNPSLAEVSATCKELDEATQAAAFTRGRQDLELRNRKYDDVRRLLIRLGAYVQSHSYGDRGLIMSAGFDVKVKRQPSQPMAAPANLRAKRMLTPGMVQLRWEAVKNRIAYQVYMTTGDPKDTAGWQLMETTSRNHLLLEQLASDQVHFFRVLAIGALGDGPLGDIASAKAA